MEPKLSYVSTPISDDILYESIPQRLRKLSDQDGNKEAFVYYDRNWTRSALSRKELYDMSLSLAKTLVNAGLRQKATVGFYMTNSIKSVIANMAVVCAGGIPFYMTGNLKDGSDIISVMNDMLCEMFIVDTDVGDDNWKILDNIWPENNTQSSAVPTLKTIVCNGTIKVGSESRVSLNSLMNSEPDVNIQLPDALPEDILLYFCTSGSTGTPKQVTYTHFNILNFTKQLSHACNMCNTNRYFCDRSFSWVVGYPRTYLAIGATRVFVDPMLTTSGKHIGRLCDVIEAESCDVVYCPNYIAVDLLLNTNLSTNFKNVKSILYSGERFPAANIRLKDTYCKDLYPFYGTTEAGAATVFESSDTCRYEDGIIGKPIGGLEAKIVDRSGNVVPRGTHGELWVRSPWRSVGYKGNDALFRSVLDDANWFHTGDIAFVRLDGNLVAAGREKEMISMQTNKFFPWSIEQVLQKVPGIVHAFAVGVPDKRSHEVVCACVVPQDGVTITSADVKDYCDRVFLSESSSMTTTSKPTHYVVLDKVPLTSSGKIDRLRIGKIARDELGL